MAYPLISLESIPPLEPYLTQRRSRPQDYDAQVTFAAILFERETYYSAIYHTYGRYGPEAPPEHDAAWQPYPVTDEGRQARAELRRLDDTIPPYGRSLDLFGLKAEALAGLQGAVRARKKDLNGYVFVARFSLDLARYDEVIAAADMADQLSPDHRAALAYRYDAVTLAALRDPDSGNAAARNVERRVRHVFGPRWASPLMRAREDHESWIRQHAWRARTANEGERFTRFLKTERQWCEEERERAVSAIDERVVPESFRFLLPLARRYGIGDDPCRSHFVSMTPKREQRQHLKAADPHLDEIQRWLDTYDPATMPAEAAAFFWLLDALEEMRQTR